MPIPPASDFTTFVKYRANIRTAVDLTYRVPARTYLARPSAGLLTSFVRETQVAQSSGVPEITSSGPNADLVLNWGGLTIGLEEQYSYVSGDYGQLSAFSPCKSTFTFALTNIQNIGDINSILLAVEGYDFTGITNENVSVSEGYVIATTDLQGNASFGVTGLTNSSVFTVTLPSRFEPICQVSEITIIYAPSTIIPLSCETAPMELNTSTLYALMNPYTDNGITITLTDAEGSTSYSINPGQFLIVNNGEVPPFNITDLTVDECYPAKTLSCLGTNTPFDVTEGLFLYNQNSDSTMTVTFNDDSTLVLGNNAGDNVPAGVTSVTGISCTPI